MIWQFSATIAVLCVPAFCIAWGYATPNEYIKNLGNVLGGPILIVGVLATATAIIAAIWGI